MNIETTVVFDFQMATKSRIFTQWLKIKSKLVFKRLVYITSVLIGTSNIQKFRLKNNQVKLLTDPYMKTYFSALKTRVENSKRFRST